MQCTPFRLIAPLSEELLGLPLDLPRLEALGIFVVCLAELPYDLAAPIAAHPLAVHIHIDVDVKATECVDRQVRSWDCLAERRSRRDGREERQHNLDGVST